MQKFVRRRPVFFRLSKNARISIRNASLIAEHLGSKIVDPEHLLVGILLNEESLAKKVLNSSGFDTQEVVSNILGSSTFDITVNMNLPREIFFSERTRDVLRKAYDWSQRYSHVYVGTEHLMLSILDSKEEWIQDISKLGLEFKEFQKQLSEYATYPLGVLSKPDVAMNDSNTSNILETIGEDIVELAREGKLDPVIGRENELNGLVKILSRRKKNNPIIVGEAGVGKTVLVEGLAQKIADGRVPPTLRDMRIVSLDVASIMAGSRMRGDVEEKVLDIVNEVVESTNTILFIDEIHTILTTGLMGGPSEIASILKPALLRDDFRCIGATTTEEYTMYFETDNALARRFQPIFLKESSVEDSIEILKNIRPILEAHHSISINDEALHAAVSLSDRYISDRALPDKAIDLLDEAAATKRLMIEGQFEELSTMISQLRSTQTAKEGYILKGYMEKAENLKRKEDTLNRRIGKLEDNIQKNKKKKESEVNIEDVRRVVSDWTGIPVNTLGTKEKSVLLKLDKSITQSLVGQKEAVDSVVSSIKRARTGIADINRPWASFLFLGPTGVGKTELAKILAKELFGDEDRLIQIDMSEMMEMHSVSKLIGSPPGYVGFREGGWLTEKVRRNPHSVILFDEIEKAHPDVLNILLQILEYGHLTDGKGRRVNFKNTIVILTSNIGAEAIRKDKVLGFTEKETTGSSKGQSDKAYSSMRSKLMEELRNTLRPELLNRLDDIVIFRSLNVRDAGKIVDLLLEDLNQRLKEQEITVTLTQKLKNHIVKEGFSEEYGARPLRRILQDTVENSMADYMLKSENIGKVKLDYKNGKVVLGK